MHEEGTFFKCEKCKYFSKRKCSLKKHQEKVHKNKTSTCKECTQFRTKPYHAQIDYVICRNTTKKDLKDARAYNGTKTETDHKLVKATLKIDNIPKLSKKTKSKTETKYDRKALLLPHIRERFKLAFDAQVDADMERNMYPNTKLFIKLSSL